MPERDPFPMNSDEARQLAESVESTESKQQWSHMTTESAGTGPRTKAADDDDDDANEKLVRSTSKQSRKSSPGDIYEDAMEDEPDDDEDEFLDRPVYESRGPNAKIIRRMRRLLEKMYHRLYGDQLPPREMLRTLCLATTLFFMIGAYWLLRSLKDPVLTALCGVESIPKAKMLSVVVVLGVVSVYNHLLDSNMPKHQLFYVFGTFYFGLFCAIALGLKHPTIGLANEQADPHRILGWISYCGIESFGSVMVSLFWSFANSNISLETAKASYGVMVATAQVGSIIGPTLVNLWSEKWGLANLYFIGACAMLLLQGTMRIYITIYGVSERSDPKRKTQAGILEGLHLFWKHNYVKGIFAISCLFMVEVTIVDYTMKVLARDYFAEEYPCERGMSCWNDNGDHYMSKDATSAFATFMGFFGQATNTLSFLLSLLGTSAVIRYLGLRLTLLLFPTLCLIVIICVRLRPTLYVVFGAMMALKACSYAFNNPTKEILYQPTSAAVRYKAKSWIDIFGARGSKAMGSIVTNAFSNSATALVANGSLVGMAVASFLIWNARFMGKKFDEYTTSGYVVGEDAVAPEEANIEMAVAQNNVEDTSCAIYDDDEVGVEEEGQIDEGKAEEDEGKAKVAMV